MSRPDGFLAFLDRHERAVSVATMVGGFCFDLIIAKRPDSVFVNVLLLSYLLISAGVIVYLARPSRRASKDPATTLAPILSMKFAFGGLASNMLILYGKSGTPAGSLLFLGVLVAMLIGNEFLKTKYDQLRFNMSVWYVLLLTYCVIAVPTWIVHDIGTAAFIESNAVSLVVALVFIIVLHGTTRIFSGREGRRHLTHALLMIASVLALFNLLYFTNIIPPVPIALRDDGIYHLIVRNADGSYGAQYEQAPSWQFWHTTSDIFTAGAGSDAYCWSSVFAPTGLGTPIRHRWELYDAPTQTWNTIAVVEFPISGGREEGYRGYSMKQNIIPGQWRCDVETESGALIGRVSFDVIPSTTSPTLSSTTL